MPNFRNLLKTDRAVRMRTEARLIAEKTWVRVHILALTLTSGKVVTIDMPKPKVARRVAGISKRLLATALCNERYDRLVMLIVAEYGAEMEKYSGKVEIAEDVRAAGGSRREVVSLERGEVA